jgi:hypothetical protein
MAGSTDQRLQDLRGLSAALVARMSLFVAMHHGSVHVGHRDGQQVANGLCLTFVLWQRN